MKQRARILVKKSGKIFLTLAPIFASALFVLLFFASESRAIWFDEAYSAALMKFNFADIWNLTAADVHPPLYYFLLKIWTSIFGVGEIRLRAMSVFFGVVAILFAWRLVRYRFGKKAAVLAVFLLALSPILLRYGAEARMYTVVAAIVFAAAFVLEKALATRQKRYWIFYALLLALGMWTHYFVAFAWLAQLIYLITILKKRIFQKKFYLIYGGAALLFAPWIPSLLSQTGQVQSGFWIPPVSANGFADFFSGSLSSAAPDAVAGWHFVLFAILTFALIYFSLHFRKKLGQLIFLAWLPPLLLIILSLPPLQPMFVQRYLLYSSLALWLILAVGAMFFVQEFRQNLARFIAKNSLNKKFHLSKKTFAKRLELIAFVATIAFFALFLYFSYQNSGNYNRQNPIARDILREISHLDQEKNRPILYAKEAGIYNYYDFAFYEKDKNPLFLIIPENRENIAGSMYPALRNKEKIVTNLDEWFAKNREFWYFSYSHERYKPHDLGENLTKKKVYRKSAAGQDYQIILFEYSAKN